MFAGLDIGVVGPIIDARFGGRPGLELTQGWHTYYRSKNNTYSS
jgi:hypothetical protein